MKQKIQDKQFLKLLKEMGNRIKTQRERKGWSQTKLAEELGLSNESRQTISNWENGTRVPPLRTLVQLCQIFDCDIGYFFSEFDLRTKEETDIKLATGLSEDAIHKLYVLRKRSKEEGDYSNFNLYLNEIIESDFFIELLEAIKKHVWSFNQNHYGINEQSIEAQESLANTFNCEPYELKGYVQMSSQSLIESILMKIVSEIK